VTYDSVSIGVPEQRVPVLPGRTGQVKEESVGALRSAAHAFNVPTDVKLVSRFHVADSDSCSGLDRVLGTV